VYGQRPRDVVRLGGGLAFRTRIAEQVSRVLFVIVSGFRTSANEITDVRIALNSQSFSDADWK